MDKKCLILALMLVLIVFLSTTIVSAENITDTIGNSEKLSSTEVTIETTDTNDQIQTKINSLNDGDTLNFQQGEYKTGMDLHYMDMTDHLQIPLLK